MLRNKIPKLLKDQDISVSELHRMTVRRGDVLSYQTCHKIGRQNAQTMPDQVEVGSLRKVAEALGVSFDALIEVLNEAS